MMGRLKKEKGEKLGWCEGSRRGAEGSGREDEKKEEEGRGEHWEEVSGPLLGGRDQKEEKMRTEEEVWER